MCLKLCLYKLLLSVKELKQQYESSSLYPGTGHLWVRCGTCHLLLRMMRTWDPQLGVEEARIRSITGCRQWPIYKELLLAGLRTCLRAHISPHVQRSAHHRTGVLAVHGNEGLKPSPQQCPGRTVLLEQLLWRRSRGPRSPHCGKGPDPAGQGAIKMQNIKPSPTRWLPVARARHWSTAIK